MSGKIRFAGDPLVLQISGRREDARLGRRFVAEVLPRLGWDELIDDVELLVTELLANVALHAQTTAQLVVRADSKTLEIEVIDSSPLPPLLRHFSAQAATGRGLRLIEQLADEWGYGPTSHGKAVWFRMRHRKVRSTKTGRQEVRVHPTNISDRTA